MKHIRPLEEVIVVSRQEIKDQAILLFERLEALPGDVMERASQAVAHDTNAHVQRDLTPIWLASLDIFPLLVRLHDDHREEVVKVSGQNRSQLPPGLATVKASAFGIAK